MRLSKKRTRNVRKVKRTLKRKQQWRAQPEQPQPQQEATPSSGGFFSRLLSKIFPNQTRCKKK